MNNSSSSNGLGQFCRQNELTKLSEDNCYLQRRDYDSRKPYRWQTYHYHPYGCKVQATCYPGQFYKDGYGIGGANVDADSCVKIHPGNVLTNPNVRQELPTLPVQLPRIRGYYDADIDSDLRPDLTESYASCNNTSEKSFMPYRFQRFKHLCYDPQDPQYIIPEDTFNCTFPNAKFYHRAGEDTRNDRTGKYRNGCDYRNKYYPPNLSYSMFGY
jgi:hypothetical protein